MQSSARRNIQHPSLDRSDRPDVPAHIKNLVDALELDAPTTQGIFSARPANPGYARWFYYATDTNLMYYWDGSTWHTVGTSDVIAQSLIDAKGDLIVGLSDNLAGRLPISANGQVLSADNTTASGLKWVLNQVLDLFAAKGDIIAGTAVDAAARVAVGSNGQALIADSTQAAGVRFGDPVHAYVESFLTSDISLTVNTFSDGPNISLAAGTWLISAQIEHSRDGTYTAKIWDLAGNVIAAGSDNGAGGGPTAHSNFHIQGIAVPSTTTTYKLSVAPDTASMSVYATPGANASGLTNKATWIRALKIA